MILSRPDLNLTAFYSNLWQTASTIVTLADAVFLFDPTYFPSEIDAIRAAVQGSDADRYLVFTHSDWDHIVGFSSFAEWSTVGHARVRDKTPQQRQAILDEIEKIDGRWYVPRATPPVYPRIDRAIDGHTTLQLSGETVHFVPTPGHTDDGIVTIFERRRLMVAGDLLSALEFPFIYHSAKAYRQTLATVRDLMRTMNINVIVPGHGPAALDAGEIDRRLTRDADYLDRLIDAVGQAVRRGVPGDDLIRELAAFTFDGQPINPHIADFHQGNIRVIEKEHTAGMFA